MPSGLSILVPAYNEEQTIVSILELLFQTQLPDNMSKEVIVINDCSTDKTPALLDDFASRYPELPLRILHCPRNQGKGAAIRQAIALASLDFLVVQDADLEYDPAEFKVLLAPLMAGKADVVYGSRFMGGQAAPNSLFWAYDGQQVPDIPEQCLNEFESYGHGNLLQDDADFGGSRPEAARKPFWL